MWISRWVQMWKRITEYESAKKYKREKSWKSQSPYSNLLSYSIHFCFKLSYTFSNNRKYWVFVSWESSCYIPNSETCLRHVWLQYDIKSPWLFSFIWVKIHSHLYLFLLSNYLFQTLQNYLNFIHSFLLFNLNSYLLFHY